ncbi:hypothetical protein [Streptomyces bungoensis]|uniref:hypothetical protein n=1 Tax=Streptomyces bungoensis TaxID=285568 RepID=UPI00131DAC3C|nr:hypothetical protein [Streptomyces bungoensis]
MRQTLTKGLVVAAAATSALSLYGTWAYADSGSRTAADSSAAALSGNTVHRNTPAPLDALKPVLGDGTSGYGDDKSAGDTSKDSAIGTPDTSGTGSSTAGSVSVTSDTKSDDTPGYGASGYGSDDSSDGYGSDDCSCGSPTPPPPTVTPAPPAKPTPTPSKTPPAKAVVPPAAPPVMAETGAEGTAAAVAGSAALLAAGTVLYRRGRTSARR